MKTKSLNLRVPNEDYELAKRGERRLNYKLTDFLRDQLKRFASISSPLHENIVKNMSFCFECKKKFDITKLKFQRVYDEENERSEYKSLCPDCQKDNSEELMEWSQLDDSSFMTDDSVLDYGFIGIINDIAEKSSFLVELDKGRLVMSDNVT